MAKYTFHNEDKSYTLHIGAAHDPVKKVKTKKVNKKSKKNMKKKSRKKAKKKEMRKETLSEKIWGWLRLVSTASIIFILLFFAMNWNAYKDIILNKFGFINSSENQQYYEDQKLTLEDDEEIIELSSDLEEQKKQIPKLSLEVYPPDMRVVIPDINKNVPVVTISSDALIKQDWDRLEQEIQEALRDGVVHYPGTAFPDEQGNVVITGHSSYFVWDPGRFKDVFALLHDVGVGDKVYVYYQQQKYEYEVYDTQIVWPTQVDVLTQVGENRLTLITCTPVGTNLKRLIVFAKPV